MRRAPLVLCTTFLLLGGACERGERPARAPDVIYKPTPQPIVEKMLELAEVKPGDVVYDLGSGDGRIPITVAKKYGARAYGWDIDPKLVRESRENAAREHIENLATFEVGDLFELDLSKADVVTLYLRPELNAKLIPQLEKLKPGSRIVSHEFAMRGVRPRHVLTVPSEDGRDHKIYLWVTPLERQQ
jgi:SAM-dependent methyltransferase